MDEDIATTLAFARACTICRDLPLGPRPIFRVASEARLLIIGQAPGRKAHVTGIPWNDASGDRLRLWMGLTRDEFYAATGVAILPVGFCYPGRAPTGGDAKPRPECAMAWHERLRALMPGITLTLLVGGSAQALALGPGGVAKRVAAWHDFLPEHLPLPHPSWRTIGWERRNPWFAAELLPELRRRVALSLHPAPLPAPRSPRR
jgi:uracil-DNA glycosylase